MKMTGCSEINQRYHTLKPSVATFRLMKECSHKYPFKPEKRRFQADGAFFYYFKGELPEFKAKEISHLWKSIGFNVRITTTKDRAIRGVKHGSWLSGSKYWHVWVSEKKKKKETR